MASDNWYAIRNIDTIDSPALVVYKDRVHENIKRLVSSIDDVSRLRPHIKTHKSAEVTKMMLEAGIRKFKCATIAEAEMLASVNAPDVLLAYQPVGPKAVRLAELVTRYPQTRFSCLIDNEPTARAIAEPFVRSGKNIEVFIDLNVGMDRTGIVPASALELYEACASLKNITIRGLHAYDGHLRDSDLTVRRKRCDEAFAHVQALQNDIEKQFHKRMVIVAGGTPTYSIHSKRNEIECSPGTYIYWDKGYEQILTEQSYLHAALVVTRIISKPAPGTICIDLGHKAIASENPLTNRVHFLNAPGLEPIGHSEEHMVFKTTQDKNYNVGDVLYGIPYHVCPTIALHDRAIIIEDHQAITEWSNLSRNRKINV